MGFQNLGMNGPVFKFLAVLEHGKAIGISVGSAKGEVARPTDPHRGRSLGVEVIARTDSGHPNLNVEGLTIGAKTHRDQHTGGVAHTPVTTIRVIGRWGRECYRYIHFLPGCNGAN